MSEQTPPKPKEEVLSIIKEIESNPTATQRALSARLNISLGKTNHLLRELILRGFIKVKNFTNNPEKLKKINYLLTEKGLQEKMRLTHHFLKKKKAEYNRLKLEWESVNNRK